MQLNRYLALCGVASRRSANEVIKQGRVTLNGESVTQLGVQVNPDQDRVEVDGKSVRPAERQVTVLFNKPESVITTVSDDFGRKTVLDFISLPERLFPIGRLDFDTTGVLLLTNDGDLAYRLTHPKYEIDKIYRAWVRGVMGPSVVDQLRSGVEIDEGVVVGGDAKILKTKRDKSLIEIKIHEGKKRQIRRMMKGVGHPVVALERICFAGLIVGHLKPGEWRELTEQEVQNLYQIAGLEKK
ncbi:rRNA pseudouridine synthase [candidate division KSB1 bacterium]|nr:rRNA pseudouridine synthase [candidate division KSB1 bacterium]